MSMGPIASRYARAILELADEAKQLDRVAKDLVDAAEMWKSSSELRDLFSNPSFSADVRKKALVDLTTRAAFSPLVKNALLYLNDRRRIEFLPDIAEAFGVLAEARAGKVRAEVISAAPLGEAYYLQLKKALEDVTGKAVTIDKKTDPSLIGGVITRVGDQVFDGSLRTRLQELTESLTA